MSMDAGAAGAFGLYPLEIKILIVVIARRETSSEPPESRALIDEKANL
ncbi:hypothetical protein [Edaphobacter dinghuensis]|uniref:Uncharacterized protein n=1 Tax=Edaphobacter dinghuensis TaxID=1560005 RepID=A0A917HQL1_9BACT|nr:hypothetical protein [Edaphobacter dinghuensis]GGG86598.1 hypothetical protein GCM10011585_33200 [Edaphobacter dinghuensis]